MPTVKHGSGNHPKHTSEVVKECPNQARIDILDWPLQSPDLNPIENMWTVLKKQYMLGS